MQAGGSFGWVSLKSALGSNSRWRQHTPAEVMFERQRNGMTDALKLSFRANPNKCDTLPSSLVHQCYRVAYLSRKLLRHLRHT
jgi:hypothetical protein